MAQKQIHATLLAIIVCAAALRFFFIAGHALNPDEITRRAAAQQSLRDIVGESFAGGLPEPNPPLFTLLLHAALAVDDSRSGLRLVSAAAGTASVFVIYCVGRRLFGVRAGLLAAFLMAASPYAVKYSLFAKQYALTAFCGLLVFWAFLRCMESLTAGSLAAYFLAAQALLWTHYSGLFLLAGFFILFRVAQARKSKAWVGLHAGILLAYGPCLFAIYQILTMQKTLIDWIQPFSADAIPRLFLIHFMGLEFIPKDPESAIYYFRMTALWALRLLVAGVFAVRFVAALREFGNRVAASEAPQPPFPQTLTFAYLLFPLFCFVAFSLALRPIYEPEYQMLVYPAFILILAHGINALASKYARAAVVLGLTMVWGWSLDHYFWDPRYHIQPW